MNERCVLLSIVVLSVIGILVSSSYAKIDPEAVVGMWLFDEGQGDVARDSSGNGNDMDLNNGVAWIEGKFSKALGFDGVDDIAMATVPGAPQGTDVRTVVAWAKSNNTGLHAGIVAYGNPVLNAVFGFMHYASGIWVSQLWGAGPDILTNVVADTSWHHHAVMYDGKDVIHYIDGEKASSEPRTPATAGTTLFAGAEPDRNNWFNGSVDEVAIFNVVLTEDDIRSIMVDGLKLGAAVSSADKLTATWGGIRE
jgi:hypothetical protein